MSFVKMLLLFIFNWFGILAAVENLEQRLVEKFSNILNLSSAAMQFIRQGDVAEELEDALDFYQNGYSELDGYKDIQAYIILVVFSWCTRRYNHSHVLLKLLTALDGLMMQQQFNCLLIDEDVLSSLKQCLEERSFGDITNLVADIRFDLLNEKITNLCSKILFIYTDNLPIAFCLGEKIECYSLLRNRALNLKNLYQLLYRDATEILAFLVRDRAGLVDRCYIYHMRVIDLSLKLQELQPALELFDDLFDKDAERAAASAAARVVFLRYQSFLTLFTDDDRWYNLPEEMDPSLSEE